MTYVCRGQCVALWQFVLAYAQVTLSQAARLSVQVYARHVTERFCGRARVGAAQIVRGPQAVMPLYFTVWPTMWRQGVQQRRSLPLQLVVYELERVGQK
jgi:hypothetical protein